MSTNKHLRARIVSLGKKLKPLYDITGSKVLTAAIDEIEPEEAVPGEAFADAKKQLHSIRPKLEEWEQQLWQEWLKALHNKMQQCKTRLEKVQFRDSYLTNLGYAPDEYKRFTALTSAIDEIEPEEAVPGEAFADAKKQLHSIRPKLEEWEQQLWQEWLKALHNKMQQCKTRLEKVQFRDSYLTNLGYAPDEYKRFTALTSAIDEIEPEGAVPGEKFAEAKERLPDFKSILEEWEKLLLPPLNPYNPGSVLNTDSPLFKGREETINEIEEAIKNGGSVILFGQPRVGKTSLLKRILAKGEYRFEFLLTSYMNGTVPSWIHRELNKKFPEIKITEEQKDVTTAFYDYIAEINEQAENIVFVFDEFNKIIDLEKSKVKTLSDILEYIIKHTKVIVIICCYIQPDKFADYNVPNTTFSAVSDNKKLKVGFLDKPDVKKIVEDPNGKPEEKQQFQDIYQEDIEKVVNTIHERTKGHPSFTQLICQKAFDEKYDNNKKVTLDYIRKMGEKGNVASVTINSIWDWASKVSYLSQQETKKLLCDIAEASRSGKPEWIKAPNEDTRKTLKILCEMEFLEQTQGESNYREGYYDYKVPLIRDWVWEHKVSKT